MENKIKENIVELENLSKKVLELKQEIIPKRPIIIEFCGAPKSGKTSCINSLHLFLRRNKFKVHVLTERASVCPVGDKFDPYFNLWTVTSAIAELSELLANRSKDLDVIIMDRGIFDAICWFNWLKKKAYLDEPNFSAIENFLIMNRWRAVIDLIYVFHVTPEVSLDREYANLLTRKFGSIMRPATLKSYLSVLIDVSKQYEQTFSKIEAIDTSALGLNDVNYKVTKNILEILRDNTSEKIGFVDKNVLKEFDGSYNEFKKYFGVNKVDVSYGVRDLVEHDSQKIQPIPILVITNSERDKVFVVKKNKKRTSSESPESQRLLIYLGGHIREEDTIESQEKNLLSISPYALHRELKEEMGIEYYPPMDKNPLCIWDQENSRSAKHIALCYTYEVDFSAFKYKIDAKEFVTGNTKTGKVWAVKELLKKSEELEEWSKVILSNVFDEPLQKKIPYK